jgi:hypothetical protein
MEIVAAADDVMAAADALITVARPMLARRSQNRHREVARQ